MHLTEHPSELRDCGTVPRQGGAVGAPGCLAIVWGDNLRDRALKDIDCLANRLPEPPQCRDGGTSKRHFWVGEKYAWGALYVIVKCDRLDGANPSDRNKLPRPSYEYLTFHFDGSSIEPDNGEMGNGCRPEDWGDDGVFVNVVQTVELVEVHSFAFDKGFRGSDGVFHPLTGCYYSIAGGLEVDPSIACRESEVAILRAIIKPDKLPNCMIHGAPQIVDSIAYYKGERGRNLFDNLNADTGISSVRVRLDNKSVRFFGNEGCELPFEIRNVIIGPLKF